MDYKKKYLKYKKKYLNAKKIYGGANFKAKTRKRPGIPLKNSQENEKKHKREEDEEEDEECEEEDEKEDEEDEEEDEECEEFVEEDEEEDEECEAVLTIFNNDLMLEEQQLTEEQLVIKKAYDKKIELKLKDTIDFDFDREEQNMTKKVVNLKPLVLFTIKDSEDKYRQKKKNFVEDSEKKLQDVVNESSIGDIINSSGANQQTSETYMVVQGVGKKIPLLIYDWENNKIDYNKEEYENIIENYGKEQDY